MTFVLQLSKYFSVLEKQIQPQKFPKNEAAKKMETIPIGPETALYHPPELSFLGYNFII